MNRLGHQAAAQATWLGICALDRVHGHPATVQIVVAGAIVASSMCADDWSPDVDQGGWCAKVIPGGHRGPTHMPELVAATLVGLWWLMAPVGLGWFVLAAAAAWGSHLVADVIWGGIPSAVATMLGHRQRIGLRLDTGGPTERVVTVLLTVAAVPLAWAALGLPVHLP